MICRPIIRQCAWQHGRGDSGRLAGARCSSVQRILQTHAAAPTGAATSRGQRRVRSDTVNALGRSSSSSSSKLDGRGGRGGAFQSICACAIAALVLVLSPAAPPPAAATADTGDTFENVPGRLGAAGADAERQQPLSRLMAGSNKKAIEGCTRKCVPTCVRGGDGERQGRRPREAPRRRLLGSFAFTA